MTQSFSLHTVCGLDELESHADRGVTHVLSILDPTREDHPAFGRYGSHRRLTLRFHDEIEPGDGIVLPERADVEAILAWGRDAYAEAGDGHMLVHCHMGISRSTAAMTMLLAQAHPGESEAEIAQRVRGIRPIAWPNSRMVEFADEILGREGRLVAAAATLYAGNLARKPELAEVMTRLNRSREVALGLAAAA
jgi:predicted protein tyrosine phosphatase